MQTVKHLKQFMEPQSVALVGTSRNTGVNSFNVLENLLNSGYQGKIYPINPSASEILGIKAYHNIAEVHENVDLAVITTPRTLVPQLVAECIKSNIRSITVIAQGFNDANDEQGKQLQKELSDIIQNSQARILGPNTFGTANAFHNFSTAFVSIGLEQVPIGLICQSGIFFVGFPDLTLTGKGLDLGNACDISFADGLEYFENDAETNVIAIHMEGTKDTRRFMDTASRVTRKKPVVTLKTGRSELASKAAQSHTGSLTGTNEAWEAALRQTGVIRANDLEEFIDLTRTFSCLPLMEGPKIGVATFSGGLGIIAIDGCQYPSLELNKLSSKTKQRLESIFPSWLNVSNPVDVWPAMMNSRPINKRLRESLEILLADKQLDAVAFIGGSFYKEYTNELCPLLNEIATTYQTKPFVCSLYGPYANEAIKELHNGGKIAAFPTPERAIRALARLNEYSLFRKRL